MNKENDEETVRVNEDMAVGKKRESEDRSLAVESSHQRRRNNHGETDWAVG